MFIKVTQTAGRRYAQLVESFRNEEGKPRQRTICTLGRLDTGREVDHLIAALQKAKGQSPSAPSLEGLRFVASRDVGDVSPCVRVVVASFFRADNPLKRPTYEKQKSLFHRI